MPLRIIESNKGGKILVDETSRTYGLLLNKKTNPPHIWYCKNKYNKSIKCQATCVTNGLDSKFSSINLHNQQMYNVSEQCIEAEQSSKVDIALKAPEI